MTLSPGKYWSLRRMANEHGHFTMLAVDQRPPIKTLCSNARGENIARFEDIRAVKKAIMQTLSPHASAVLADPTYALTDALKILKPQHGLIITLEDSLFKDNVGGRVSDSIKNWSVEKINRVGGDAVKVLIWYRPDQSDASRQKQLDYAKRVGDACRQFDIPFLLEFLVYPMKDASNHTLDYVEQTDKRSDHVLKTVEDFSSDEYGVDIFKLESPIPAPQVPNPTEGGSNADSCQKWFDELGKIANRPWVMLSAGAGKADFRNVLHYAYGAGASGFLAGRAIWWEDAQHFPNLDRMQEAMNNNAAQYMKEIAKLTTDKATQWEQHTVYKGKPGPTGDDIQNFPEWYM